MGVAPSTPRPEVAWAKSRTRLEGLVGTGPTVVSEDWSARDELQKMFAYPDGRYGEVHDGPMMGRRLLDEREAAESQGVAVGRFPISEHHLGLLPGV